MVDAVTLIAGIAIGIGISNIINAILAEKAGTLSYCDYCKHKKRRH